MIRGYKGFDQNELVETCWYCLIPPGGKGYCLSGADEDTEEYDFPFVIETAEGSELTTLQELKDYMERNFPWLPGTVDTVYMPNHEGRLFMATDISGDVPVRGEEYDQMIRYDLNLGNDGSLKINGQQEMALFDNIYLVVAAEEFERAVYLYRALRYGSDAALHYTADEIANDAVAGVQEKAESIKGKVEAVRDIVSTAISNADDVNELRLDKHDQRKNMINNIADNLEDGRSKLDNILNDLHDLQETVAEHGSPPETED